MSRPKINEQDKRLVQVNIRLTENESRVINEQAEGSALSPANWIRHKVFTDKFPPLKEAALDVSVYQELNKIGVNLNQAVHKLNQGDTPHDLVKPVHELLDLNKRIINLLLHDRRSEKA
ncbi:MAG: hypothetical protein DI539_27405 [Flavobacterium psychrophilum]|nr:MAG: hypothetical protein DI539_27405 [Flavobacterium psychrophilum]